MQGTEIARINGIYSTSFIETYELTGQSTAGNYSTFKIRVYGHYGGNTGSAGSSYCTVWISGTEYNAGSYRLYPNSYTLFAQKDITIQHNDDGSFPSTTVAFAINSYHANGETSGSISAPAIPRKATITSAPNFNDEENPTITYSNPAGTAVTSLQTCIANPQGNVIYVSYRDISKTGTSYTFELTNEERQTLRQATTGTPNLSVKFYVKTVIGGSTYTSTLDKTMTIINGEPTFSNFEYEDINSTTVALTGDSSKLINGYSIVKGTVSVANKATANKEATMVSYTLKCGENNSNQDDYSATESVEITLNSPAISDTVKMYATDNRNTSKIVEKLATLVNYQPLIFTSINVARENGSSEETRLTLQGTIDEVNFGAVTNSIVSATYKYISNASGSTWSADIPITLTVSNGQFSFDSLILGDTNTGFDIENTYTIVVDIQDKLSSLTSGELALNSGKPNLALAKTGVAVMQKYDETLGGALQVNGATYINGENVTKRKAATIYLSNEVSNISETTIPFNAIISNTDKLTLSNNGIRIGAGVSYVLVSGNVFLAATSNNSYLWTKTQKVSSNSTWDIGVAIDNYNTYFASTSHSPHIIDVVEGDIIKIFKIDTSNGTIRANANTYLTVEIIQED